MGNLRGARIYLNSLTRGSLSGAPKPQNRGSIFEFCEICVSADVNISPFTDLKYAQLTRVVCSSIPDRRRCPQSLERRLVGAHVWCRSERMRLGDQRRVLCVRSAVQDRVHAGHDRRRHGRVHGQLLPHGRRRREGHVRSHAHGRSGRVRGGVHAGPRLQRLDGRCAPLGRDASGQGLLQDHGPCDDVGGDGIRLER